jgi:hypothetical protein
MSAVRQANVPVAVPWDREMQAVVRGVRLPGEGPQARQSGTGLTGAANGPHSSREGESLAQERV